MKGKRDPIEKHYDGMKLAMKFFMIGMVVILGVLAYNLYKLPT